MRRWRLSGRIRPGHTQTDTHTHTHMLLCLEKQRPEPAGSHNSREEEEYQTTGSFFCWGLQKHGCLTLQELCWRGQEIGPRWDSTAMRLERASERDREGNNTTRVFQIRKKGKSVNASTRGRESSKPIFKSICKHGYIKPDQRAH